MREFTDIEQNLSVSKDIHKTLDELGTLLRNTSARQSYEATNVIPSVIALYQDAPLECLRVLVNFSADNIKNRYYLLTNDTVAKQLWVSVTQTDLSKSDVSRRCMIFISQFVHSVEQDDLTEFFKILSKWNVSEWVLGFYNSLSHFEDLQDSLLAVEFLASYSKENQKKIAFSSINTIVRGFEQVLQTIEENTDPLELEEVDECCLYHSQFLLNITNVEDSSAEIPIYDMLNLLPLVSEKLSNFAHIKRNLFAACGNISSYPSFDNATNLSKMVHILLSSDDPYVVSALTISLGNCVTDKASQTTLLRELRSFSSVEEITNKILHLRYGDIIQYQGFHFFNNIMTQETASVILEASNIENLMRHTKAIVDNFKYYPEVGLLYLKFLKKLVIHGFASENSGNRLPQTYEALWKLLADHDEFLEVLMLVSQTYSQQHDLKSQFQTVLMNKALSLGDTVNADQLLIKLKTFAIFLKNYPCEELKQLYGIERFETVFLTDVLKFVEQLEYALNQNNTSNLSNNADSISRTAEGAVLNNSKFVAAAVLERISSSQLPHSELTASINDASLRILRL